ncbi:glycosyltransferase family 2 protein [Paraburkholderia sp. MM5384-R2]|uniref:glycosyltransferase family 2 protein n=1 Tax=Paraburkholderia sp. MM5384-R2 TaxID=2723097 RepID=UPI00160DAFBC|nr:glycosyltransferase family 2 protein [Paraburkholderia sp. MM5384-R2]MBB5502570.1 glycosyltransferase involved in cell wall biosynthesis [Paraburkholderia sp. MM5384-R2]
MSNVSVLVLTKNEEQDLPGCLETVIGWSDDIHVFDSLSTDGTVAYARSLCANVISRPFDDWSTHQNWGLKNIPFKHEWVLYLDADERVPPLLQPEIEMAVSNAGDAVAFQIRRRDFFNDRWLRHVQASPYFVRLFRPQHIHYERLVNPVTVVDGKTGRLDGYLDHFPFSKGLSHWLSRHNAYSSLEADQFLRNKANGNKFSLSKALFAADFQTRRYHQKRLFYQLPCRPVIKFVLLYLVRRGFLDGHPGLVYATLQSVYEYFIVLKVREKMRAARTQVDRPTLSEELKS